VKFEKKCSLTGSLPQSLHWKRDKVSFRLRMKEQAKQQPNLESFNKFTHHT